MKESVREWWNKPEKELPEWMKDSRVTLNPELTPTDKARENYLRRKHFATPGDFPRAYELS